MAKSNRIKNLDEVSLEELKEMLSSQEFTGEDSLALKREIKLRKELEDIQIKESTAIKISKSLEEEKGLSWWLKILLVLKGETITLWSIVIIAVAGSSIIMYYPSGKPDNYYQYTQEVLGKIEKVESVGGWAQGLDGAYLITHAYNVHYTYRVNNKVYVSKELFENRFGINKHIQLMRDYIGREGFPIKYKSENPEASILDVYSFE